MIELSEVIEALLRVIVIIANNPQLILIVLGFLMILIGWTFSAGWIIVLGFFVLIIGIITKKSRGEISKSPVHY